MAGANTTPVIISNPPELAWCETTHAGFSPAFRQQAQALLLCWQRQGGAAGWGSGGDGGGSLGSLPYDLVGGGWGATAGGGCWLAVVLPGGIFATCWQEC